MPPEEMQRSAAQLPDILQRIVAAVRADLPQRQRRLPLHELRRRVEASTGRPAHALLGALRGPGPSFIAEIKKASPSGGRFAELLPDAQRARLYAAGGAAALSIVTEEHFFQGSMALFEDIRGVMELPLLRKDFIIDAYQLHEARAAGADAVLLIAALLDAHQLSDFLCLSHELGMDALVEVVNREELECAVACQARIIGVNNRDLRSFEVRLERSLELAPCFPAGIIAVAESGLKTRQDIVLLHQAGFQAFLIGSQLMRQARPDELLRSLHGIVSDGPSAE